MPTVRLDCSDVEVDFIVLHRIKGTRASKGEVVSPEEGVFNMAYNLIILSCNYQNWHGIPVWSFINRFGLWDAPTQQSKGRVGGNLIRRKLLDEWKAINLIVSADSVWRNPLSSCERNWVPTTASPVTIENRLANTVNQLLGLWLLYRHFWVNIPTGIDRTFQLLQRTVDLMEPVDQYSPLMIYVLSWWSAFFFFVRVPSMHRLFSWLYAK